MPVVGERKSLNLGRKCVTESMYGLATQFRDLAKNILTESGIDMFMEPTKVAAYREPSEAMKNFFVNESCDPNSMTPDQYDDHIEMMTEQFENDKYAMLECASMASFNPVIGMSFPLHKNILMNCVFDKGAIPKVVTKSPKFTITMENRYLVKPDGTKIDIYKNQMDITDAIESTAPFKEIELKLPETGATDILEKIGASSLDNLSIETAICAVKMKVKKAFQRDEILPDGTKAEKEETDVWFPVNLKFSPAYGDLDRTLMERVVISDSHADPAKNDDLISASMKDNKIQIMGMKGNITAVKLRTRKDTSNAMLQTCTATWDTKTIVEEIPSAIPINTTISPEEVKDLAALYNVNQLSKIMTIFNDVLGNLKDDQIRKSLDMSYKTIPESQKDYGVFDFAPRDGYMSDHVDWRHSTFMDLLDSHVTNMLNILNDQNMVVSIFGRPDVIRKITPTEYTYQTPSNIGPVELDFTRTVCTSDRRVYQFISSQKLNNQNELIIILCPRNSERIIYRIYDYQMYLSNEIRNAANPTLPAIHAFQRWKFVEYQPVQGRLRILNPTGLREGKDIPTLGSLGAIGYGNNQIIPAATTPKGEK